MIGIRAILSEWTLVAVGLFLLGRLIRPRRPTKTSKRGFNDTRTRSHLLNISICILFLAAAANLMVRELRFHSELSHLRPETVQSIEIGNRSVTDRREIAEIVDVLNHAEWFSMAKGDRADLVPFIVKLVSGEEHAYQATRYQRGEGAALVSRSPAGWNNGEVFCRKLPASLAKAGIKLPPCFTNFNKPLHCAPD